MIQPISVQALSYTVTNTSDSGAGSLRQAILNANANAGTDAITIAVTGTINVNSALPSLSQSVTITGPGAATLTVQRPLNAATNFRIFTVNSGQTVTIAGMTISGGVTAGGGGGIFNFGTLTLENAVLSANTATSGGGGISNSGTVTINNSTIRNNSTTADGGGVFSGIGATTIINNSLIHNNLAGRGGGVFGNATINNSQVYNNNATSSDASGGGGGIYGGGSLYRTTVSGNTANSKGGGIMVANTNLGLTESTVTDNDADSNGGGVYIAQNFSATILQSTVDTNRANGGGGGGGIYADGSLTLYNSTVSGNLADNNGGGMFLMSSSSILHSTIVFNVANADNDGLGTVGGIGTGTSSVSIGNSLVVGNRRRTSSPETDNCDLETLSTLGKNIFGLGGFCPSNANNTIFSGNLAPLINAALANNGGLTRTHALPAGSPAISGGVNQVATDFALTTDQRGTGYPRILGTVDLGAVESSVVSVFPPANTNLILGGDFATANALNNFAFFNTIAQVSGGALSVFRSVGTPDGGFFQTVNITAPASERFELAFTMGNTANVAKSITVIMRSTSWSQQKTCPFTIPAQSPGQRYIMRFRMDADTQPVVMQFLLNQADSLPGLLIDDLALQYRPDLQFSLTTCIVEPPVNTNFVYDSGFSAGLSSWAAFGTINAVPAVSSGNNLLELWRGVGAAGDAGIYQFNPYSTPANGTLRFSFRLGNRGNVFKTAVMIVRNPDWTNLRICYVTVPANSAFASMTMLARATTAWQNTVIQVYLPQTDGVQALQLDDLEVRYIPGLAFNGSVQCPLFGQSADDLDAWAGFAAEGFAMDDGVITSVSSSISAPAAPVFIPPANATVGDGGIVPMPPAPVAVEEAAKP